MKRVRWVCWAGEVVLEPGLDARVRQLASATANYKKHGSPFKNTMFYGPPGARNSPVALDLYPRHPVRLCKSMLRTLLTRMLKSH